MNFLSDCDLTVLKLLLCIYVAPGTGDAIHRNRPSHGLALHTDGEKHYHFSDGTNLTVRKNDLIYLPKHSDYQVESINPGGCYAINFDIADTEKKEPFVLSVKAPQPLLSSFIKAESLWKTKTQGYLLQCRSELYHILYLLNSCHNDYVSAEKRNLIAPALQTIQARYCEELLSISELSDLCGITPEYFRRIFKSCFGMSPILYIRQLKIERARELLENGYSVTASAERAGFSDISHFSREFKKIVGVSPSVYAKEIVKKI